MGFSEQRKSHGQEASSKTPVKNLSEISQAFARLFHAMMLWNKICFGFQLESRRRGVCA
jgi:hypothetical protein